jgi:hypothetical protein
MTLAPDLVEAELNAGALCCPGCDGRLAPWGVRARAGGPDTRRLTAGEAASRVLRLVRGAARDPAGVAGPTTTRRRRGDRSRAARQDTGGRATARSLPGSSGRRQQSAAGYAPPHSGPRRCTRARHDGLWRSTRPPRRCARLPRRWPARSIRSARRPAPAACSSECAPRRGSSPSR